MDNYLTNSCITPDEYWKLGWSRKVTLVTGWLVYSRWQTSSITVNGVTTHLYQLIFQGKGKIGKRDLKWLSGDDYARTELQHAFREWVNAGKPEEFVSKH